MESVPTPSTPSRLPRYKRVANYPSIRIGRPKQLILEALGRFDYLSAPQLTRLLYSPKSLTFVRQHCAELYQDKYIQRVYLPSLVPRGSPLAIYCLDNKGMALLRAEGKAPEGRFHAKELADREIFFLRHTLEANDLLILALILSNMAPVQVHRFLTERELKRFPVYVSLESGRLSVVPDGWVDFRHGGHVTCAAFELDRGTVERRPFQRKIEGLVRYAGKPYQEAFDTESITVLFVTTAGERRQKEIINWTERTLTELRATDQADLFLFAAFDPATADPSQVFLQPWWVAPFAPARQAFFEGGVPPGA